MTKPRSGDAGEKPDQPKGGTAAVRVRTHAANEQDTAKAKTLEPVEGEANEPENTAGVQDPREADAVTSDDAHVDQKPAGNAQRWIGQTRARRAGGRRPGPVVRSGARGATQPDSRVAEQESVKDAAKDSPDAAVPADAEDGSDAEAAISEDAQAEEQADAEAEEKAEEGEPVKAKRQISWSHVVVYGVIPGVALLLAPAAGFLKWQDSLARESQIARIESVAAAKDSTIALLSYQSATVEKDLDAAKSRLTGTFKDSYSQLINDVVIPGAKRGHISAKATVPAAASVSATPNHAVTLLFVNQTAVVDKDPPSDSTTSVRVTMDKVAGRWLISGFDPV
jgi:Mce-associated membrane protein